MATQTILGRFYLTTTSDTFAFNNGSGSHSVSIVSATGAGPYYMQGYAGGSESQLCEVIQAGLRNYGGFAAATCNFSPATRKVTFTFAAATNLSFTDTALGTILGFTSNAVNVTTVTGSRECRYVWAPGRPPADHPVTLAQFWEDESTTVVQRARDGTTVSVQGQTTQRALLAYQYIAEARAITPSTGTIGQDFEAFFADVICAGQPMRIILDDTTYAATGDYVTAVVGDEGEEIGGFRDYAQRVLPNSNNLWNIELPLMRWV